MPHVSTIYARFITRELQLAPHEIDSLLSGSALDSQALFERNSMPSSVFFDFLTKVNKQSDDKALGLKVGKKLAPMSLGELGNAILVAPNLLESFTIASNFVQLHATYMELKLIANINELTVVFVETADLGNTQQFQTEVLLLLVQNVIEALSGRPFTDGEFLFPYATPDNQERYSGYFNSPVSFGHEHACIQIPRLYLSLQSPFHDPAAWKNYQVKFVTQLNQLKKTDEKPFTKHVNDFLQAYPPPLPSVVETANSLHITERTLNRKLRSEGSSFRSMRNAVLQSHAELYLKETDLTVDAIASQLGYRDFSSFRRVFKKWTNLSPQAYREKAEPPH